MALQDPTESCVFGGFLDRVRARLYRAGAFWLLHSRYGGSRMRGAEWDGFALSCHAVTARAIQRCIDRLFGDVRRAICSDFTSTNALNRRLFVAYTPSHVPVDAVALLLAPTPLNG